MEENSAPTGPTTPKFKVILQYLGSRYHGWQIQKGQVTVQGIIRDTLATLAGRSVAVVGASRTDAGVHALGQVAHFHFRPKETIPNLQRTLNALLPWDIRIVHLQQVSEDFHAQKSARKKRYEYRIFNGEVFPPFLHNQSTHLPGELDIKLMREGAELVLGDHDFSGFAAASTTVENRVRKVVASEILKQGRHINYRIEADGFLHHMVRNIVGTLLEIGQGKRPPEEVLHILESRDRQLAGPTARPEGLYLARIWY
jgi:tRNA pseudouridine38-40 synthase